MRALESSYMSDQRERGRNRETHILENPVFGKSKPEIAASIVLLRIDETSTDIRVEFLRRWHGDF